MAPTLHAPGCNPGTGVELARCDGKCAIRNAHDVDRRQALDGGAVAQFPVAVVAPALDRAASIAAFSAKRLACSATSRITRTILEIFCEFSPSS